MDLRQIATLEFEEAVAHYLAFHGVVPDARDARMIEIVRTPATIHDGPANHVSFRAAHDGDWRKHYIPASPEEFLFEVNRALILTEPKPGNDAGF